MCCRPVAVVIMHVNKYEIKKKYKSLESLTLFNDSKLFHTYRRGLHFRNIKCGNELLISISEKLMDELNLLLKLTKETNIRNSYELVYCKLTC